MQTINISIITGEVANLEEAIKKVNAEIQAENSNLHVLNTSLHETNHAISLKVDFGIWKFVYVFIFKFCVS